MKFQNTLSLLALIACSTEAFTVAPSRSVAASVVQSPITYTSTAPTTSTSLYAEESGEAETETGEGENVEEAAKEEPAKSSGSDDILNSPAFLTRKIDVLKSDIEAVNAKIEEQNKIYEENKAEWGPQLEDLRKEYATMQERLKKQSDGASALAVRELAQKLLSVLDNYDRAFAAVEAESDEEKAIEASYKAIHADILAVLAELGVKPVETVGIEFDYEFHQAVMMRPDEDHDEGIVCEELAKGYALEDGTLVRAAMVVVAA